MSSPNIAFIGAGNMATALIRGLLQNGRAPASIHAADPVAEQLDKLAQLGVVPHGNNNDAVAQAEIVVLAIKPQLAGEVICALSELTPKHLVISIAAGINLDSLTSWTGQTQPLIRCMPNTPALLGAGITALYANAACQQPHLDAATEILSAAGDTLWVDNEAALDAVTAVSGSGPAYFFLLMEAMVSAGQQLGLSTATATRLTLQTAYGAALMARQSDDSPSVLRENVTSPGGTTAAALAVMQAAGLPDTIAQAVVAAEQRAGELAEEFGR